MNNNKGFTLVELLAVIVVLAIILAVAIPAISGVVTSSKKAAFESDARMIITGIQYKIAENTINSAVTKPAVHAAAQTTVAELAVLSNYGGNPANYSSFQITSISPVTIKLTSTAASKFGSFTATITKTSITYP